MFSILILFAAVPADAQALASLQQGARIKIEGNHGRGKVGTFMGVSNDSLQFLRDGESSSATAIHLGEVKSVQVSRGRSRSSGLLVDGLIGTAVGIGVGGILGAATYRGIPNCSICSASDAAVIGAVVGGAGGLIVGSVYGVSRGREVWESVPMRSR